MDFDSTQPIWLQLVGEFSRRIGAGEWRPGARIPAVRDLAAELQVNPNTVQRAFGELERDRLVRSERTSGRFVTDDATLIRTLRRRLVADAADAYARRAAGVGLPLADAQALLAERWSEHDHENPDEHDTHVSHRAEG
ncbi:DNA-binding transcriptional regulator YhcF, GntR family [Agrococcus baldri]|uniref:DNA-binding transcriptional regulator YhcF, GntR family n=1 Tax=Agrococcus baldri TaxID=153730 RepID=A0AA94KZH1_9MICO|nr:GntR family transcriptional regulator [Agrococcus baldri]SFS10175.1 DNA-binding transcriptional regulator YhcF, GntR family [Agrococcus baldri]